MNTRREFLKQSAVVSLAPLLPGFLPRSVRGVDVAANGRVLVVIQLDGGNDGLNTVVPFADEDYVKRRKVLGIAPKDVLKLNDRLGLNPGMKGAAELFESGRLAIVQGVGYPNPNRSHFESMSIWQHARLDSSQHDSVGWLGRACDASNRHRGSSPDSIFVGRDSVPVALRGRRAVALAMESEADLELVGGGDPHEPSSAAGSDLSAFIQRTTDESYVAARRFQENAPSSRSSSAAYPSSGLARHLQLISRLIKLGGETRLYYASQSGYDTHSAQAFPHRQRLGEFSGALKAFLDDLRESQLDDRVVVLAFSEFGRRVQENDSAGTDHGTAGPVFIAGSPARGGLVGEHPSLTDLDDGDLRMRYDFRQVYATLLSDWLGRPAANILGGSFEPLPLLKPSSVTG